MIIGFLLAALSAAGASGCASPQPQATQTLQRLTSIDELQPDAYAAETARLTYPGGIELPVEISVERQDERYTINILAHGQELEEEVYLIRPGGVQIVRAAAEEFEPPIPLLRFPMEIGQPMEWEGLMTTGDIERKATAVIETSLDTVTSPGDAVRTNVTLQFESGGPQPAKRVLSFWFVKGQGLVKREFGAGSTRLPAPPP
jgi:hypothetical protein